MSFYIGLEKHVPAREKPLSPVPTIRVVLALVRPPPPLRARPPPQLVPVRVDEAAGSNEEPKRPRAHSREAL